MNGIVEVVSEAPLADGEQGTSTYLINGDNKKMLHTTMLHLLGMTYEELMTGNVTPNCSIKNVYHHNLMVDQNVRSSSNVIECCLDETIKIFLMLWSLKQEVNNDTYHYMIAKDINGSLLARKRCI